MAGATETSRRRAELELEGNTAAHGTGGMGQIDGLAILSEDGHISLSQQVAHVDHSFHMTSKERDGLAEEDVEEGMLAWPAEALNMSTGVSSGPFTQRSEAIQRVWVRGTTPLSLAATA